MLGDNDGYEPRDAIPRWSPQAARITGRNMRSVKLSIGAVIFAGLTILLVNVMCHKESERDDGVAASAKTWNKATKVNKAQSRHH